jgi:hypothetical protein
MTQLLIITGSMGAGKSTILAGASDILRLRGIAYAAIDVDSLFLGHVPLVANDDDLMYANLRSVCKNYAEAGVQRFMLARALETQTELDLCSEITSATATTVCRLTATIDTMQRRVASRELGILQQEFVARTVELNSILDRAHLEDFAIANENRSLNEVALEMLHKAGWISN